MKTTTHARTRCQQRAISAWDVDQVLNFGYAIYKQGMRFMFMPKKDIRTFYQPDSQSSLEDLMILVADDGAIITAYRHIDAVKNVKRKSKRLCKEAKSKKHNIRIVNKYNNPLIAA
jgi:phage FluMu gp28-like protein